ncbi:MAG: 4Fe-4S binding protein [Syntrophomonadaceae bacterium]|nr:4Fe-4S binding protein [Syntrophomonadaceae bacterium]
MCRRLRRPLIVTFALLLLLLAAAPAMAWDDCPKNKVVCDQPCRDYIDSNNNGTCDHLEPAPSSSSKTTPAATVTTTTTARPTTTTTSLPAASPSSGISTSSGAASSSSTPSSGNVAATADSAAHDFLATAEDTAASQTASPAQNLSTALRQPSFVFTLLLLVGAWVAVRRKLPGRVRLVILGLSLGILGFYLQGCMCPVGVLANLPLRITGLLQGKYMLWLLLFFTPVVFLFWGGRIFCGGVCPIGAVQEFTFRLGCKLGLNRGRPGLEKWDWLKYGKYLALLGILLVTPLLGTAWWCDLDPFGYLFNLSGSKIALGLLVVILTVSLFVSRFWCRFLCPYGALLGILNKDLAWARQNLGLGLGGPVIDASRCKNCGKCARSCPVDAISACAIDAAECINCGECSRQCKLGAVITEEMLPANPRPAWPKIN